MSSRTERTTSRVIPGYPRTGHQAPTVFRMLDGPPSSVKTPLSNRACESWKSRSSCEANFHGCATQTSLSKMKCDINHVNAYV
eukprot:1184346-Prorocentrum_minimum.AAC.3